MLGDESSSIRQIADTPVMIDEARGVAFYLRSAAILPSGAEGVMLVVGEMFAVYRQPERDDGEWQAFWRPYVDTLERQTVASLRGAVKVWHAKPDSEFLPKPGRLLELAKQVVTTEATMAHRAEKAVALADSRKPAERGPPPPKEEIDAMMDDFRSKMAALKPPPPPRAERPPTHGQLHPGLSITSELAELEASRMAS